MKNCYGFFKMAFTEKFHRLFHQKNSTLVKTQQTKTTGVFLKETQF